MTVDRFTAASVIGWAMAVAIFVGGCDHRSVPVQAAEPALDAGPSALDASVPDDASIGGGRDRDAADAASAADAPVATPSAFVHVSNGALVNPDGSPLLLRAIGLGDWLLPEGYMWQFDGPAGDRPRRIEARVAELLGDANAKAFWKTWRDTFVTEADVVRMKALGFNAIRVAMNARLLMPEGMPEGQDTFDEDGFTSLANLVAWCAAHDVGVILDMHAAPGGQTGTNIDDDVSDNPELFTEPLHQDRLVALWTEIAKRFADSRAVLGFDLLNEPLAPAFAPHNAELWPLYQRIGAAIRAVDANHLLIFEGAQWANDWSSLAAPFDPQSMYSFHKYWDEPTLASITPFIDQAAQWHAPAWIGETGENDDTWYASAFPIFEASHVGWSFWTWKKMESDNNPYAIAAPAGWSAIQAYVSNPTDPTKKPTQAVAQAAFDALAVNVALANCRYNAHVLCAVLPSVNAPCP